MNSFECKKCGKCCSNLLPLSKEDIHIIKKQKNLKENKLIVDKDWYMRCPFLNNQNKCDIYEDRPEICRQYTCYAFDNMQYSESFMKKIKTISYKLTDLRKEFFGGTNE